jgi:hypothetical protein
VAVVFCFIGGVSFHPGANREALVEVGLQPKGYAAYLIYTPFDGSSLKASIHAASGSIHLVKLPTRLPEDPQNLGQAR